MPKHSLRMPQTVDLGRCTYLWGLATVVGRTLQLQLSMDTKFKRHSLLISAEVGIVGMCRVLWLVL